VSLSAGTRPGPYEILTPLGASGMPRCIARATRRWIETRDQSPDRVVRQSRTATAGG